MTDEDQTALIALDWGTSSLRAFRLNGEGKILEHRKTEHGIQHLPAAGIEGFELAFAKICEGWIDHKVPIIAGGMIGSAQGWIEAPYVACPASLNTLCGKGPLVTTRTGKTVLITPGLMCQPNGQTPDVMRGEEVQIAGTIARSIHWRKKSLLIMPGTHSKWVHVENNIVKNFSTFMTGELFSLLSQHSILGRLMQEAGPIDGKASEEAFLLGVDKAREAGGCALTHQLFSVRTLGLMKVVQPAMLSDYLSGLLIGHEIVSGQTHGWLEDTTPLLLVGEDALCSRYSTALFHLSASVAARVENPAPDGLFWFAKVAGLLD